jgi:hypothetical protein
MMIMLDLRLKTDSRWIEYRNCCVELMHYQQPRQMFKTIYICSFRSRSLAGIGISDFSFT